MRHLVFKLRLIGLVPFVLVGGMWPVAAQAASSPSLGSAAGFAVLAGTAATCTTSTITGKVGVNFNPPTTAGCNAQYAPAAYSAFRSAFTGTRPACVTTLGATLPNATTNLGPGTYCTGAALTFTDQTLNLTGTGPWNFIIGAGLTGTNLSVVMANGGNPCNVSWWVGADVTLTVNKPVSAPFQGTILGGGAITLTGSAGDPTALTLTGHVWATTAVTMTNSTIVGCNAAGTVACRNGAGNDVDEDGGQSGETGDKSGETGDKSGETGDKSGETEDKSGDEASCKPAKQHCNQGVGNGHEGCDPGNSNQGDESRSNDELGGTPGNPGRKGGDAKISVKTASLTSFKGSAIVAVAPKNNSHAGSAIVAVASKSNSHATHVLKGTGVAANGKSGLHGDGKSKGKNK